MNINNHKSIYSRVNGWTTATTKVSIPGLTDEHQQPQKYLFQIWKQMTRAVADKYKISSSKDKRYWTSCHCGSPIPGNQSLGIYRKRFSMSSEMNNLLLKLLISKNNDSDKRTSVEGNEIWSLTAPRRILWCKSKAVNQVLTVSTNDEITVFTTRSVMDSRRQIWKLFAYCMMQSMATWTGVSKHTWTEHWRYSRRFELDTSCRKRRRRIPHIDENLALVQKQIDGFYKTKCLFSVASKCILVTILWNPLLIFRFVVCWSPLFY
jgi:hypothetical protein